MSVNLLEAHVSSSSSESVSESEDNSVLSTTSKIFPRFDFSTSTTPNPAYASKKRKIGSGSVLTQQDSDSDDAFSVVIPSIFDSIGARNDRLYTKDTVIKQGIKSDADKVRKEYEKLRKCKADILRELNDNGEGVKYDKDEKYIDSLVKQMYSRNDGFGISRHFYFLKRYETGHIEYPITQSLLDLIARSPERTMKKVIWPSLPKFISSVLASEHNPSHLKQINKMIETATGLHYELEEDPFENNEFSKLVFSYNNPKGDTCSTVDMQLKTNHFNNHIPQTLLKLAIIFNLKLMNVRSSCSYLTVGSRNQIVDDFVMIISDYNANREYAYLQYFIDSVFPNIVRVYCEDEEHERGFLYDLKHSIFHLSTVNYDESQPTKIKKMDYELQYNILRNLNVIFATTKNKSVLRIISCLNTEFYQGYIDSFDVKPDKNMFDKLKIKDLLFLLETEDTGSINEMYHVHSMIRLLKFMIKSLDVAMKRSENLTRLTNLKAYVDDLRKNMLDNINIMGNSKLSDKSMIDKNEVVSMITNNYYVLNNIYIQLDKDSDLVKQDFFYEESHDVTQPF